MTVHSISGREKREISELQSLVMGVKRWHARVRSDDTLLIFWPMIVWRCNLLSTYCVLWTTLFSVLPVFIIFLTPCVSFSHFPCNWLSPFALFLAHSIIVKTFCNKISNVCGSWVCGFCKHFQWWFVILWSLKTAGLVLAGRQNGYVHFQESLETEKG